MNIILLALTIATQPAPSAEAEALGQRLAELVTPLHKGRTLAKANAEGMLAGRIEMSAQDKELFDAIAAETGERALKAIIANVGRLYANELSVDEMKRLIAFYDTPLASKFEEVRTNATFAIMFGGWDGRAIVEETLTLWCVQKKLDPCPQLLDGDEPAGE